ncbi:MAG: DUF488 family protein [Actinomycetota bacterium]|jgi:uncharacterized protein YeaO (DUF488 family)|nr:DUF488 family protein [Actinomycetota bacterium]
MEPVQSAIIRVYGDQGRSPGDYRVLVDRLWPRGLTREAVDYDEWAKELAPSSELRKWYGHDRDRFEEFSWRYRAELDEDSRKATLKRLLERARPFRLVLLTATLDVEYSGAAVLQSTMQSLSDSA